jgi:hypothetical protein
MSHDKMPKTTETQTSRSAVVSYPHPVRAAQGRLLSGMKP